MISDGNNSGIRKLNTINRRMFVISAAKFVVFTGIITRLFSLYNFIIKLSKLYFTNIIFFIQNRLWTNTF